MFDQAIELALDNPNTGIGCTVAARIAKNTLRRYPEQEIHKLHSLVERLLRSGKTEEAMEILLRPRQHISDNAGKNKPSQNKPENLSRVEQ